MSQAEKLLSVLDNLSWENFPIIADAVTKFDKDDIDDEMVRQASIFSYYQGMLAQAKQHLDKANLDLTTYTASSRKEAKACSSIKLTAKDLDDAVESSENFKTLSKQAIDAQFKYTLLKGLVSALDHKKDMLVQLSSNRRSESNLYR